MLCEGIRSAPVAGVAREPRGARPLGRELPKANGRERRGPRIALALSICDIMLIWV